MPKNPQVFYPESILELARKNALEMINSGESFRTIQFGRDSGSFYLSDDKSKVIGDKYVEVDGKKFHLGIFKK
jgi:hypothetical protein